jgi:hypothetical protein
MRERIRILIEDKAYEDTQSLQKRDDSVRTWRELMRMPLYFRIPAADKCGECIREPIKE